MKVYILFCVRGQIIGVYSSMELVEKVKSQYPKGTITSVVESTLDEILDIPEGVFTYSVMFDLEGFCMRTNRIDPRHCTDEVVEAGDNGMFGTYCWASSAAEAIALAEKRRQAYVEKLVFDGWRQPDDV